MKVITIDLTAGEDTHSHVLRHERPTTILGSSGVCMIDEPWRTSHSLSEDDRKRINEWIEQYLPRPRPCV